MCKNNDSGFYYINKLSYGSRTKKRIGFVIQKNENFSMKWESFNKPENYILVLITATNINNLRSSGTVFDHIVFSKEFTLKTIENTCLEIAKKEGVDLKDCFFVTHDEYAIEFCALLREKYHSYGDRINSLEPYRNKLTAKAVLRNSDVPLPNHVHFDYNRLSTDKNNYLKEIIISIGFPMFIKPINEARCKDVAKINSAEELRTWANKNPKGDYEIDEFLEGDLYTAMFVIKNKEIVLFGTHKFLYPCFEFMNQKKPLAGYTLANNDSDSKALLMLTKKVLKKIPVSDGVGHIEFMKKTKTGEFVFIEAAARQPGGYISDLFEKRMGINLGVLHYSLQMRIDTDINPKYKYFAAWYWPNKPTGVVNKIHEPNIKSQYEINFRIHENELVNGSQFLGDSAYRLLLWNKSLVELKNDLLELENHNIYTLR